MFHVLSNDIKSQVEYLSSLGIQLHNKLCTLNSHAYPKH